MVGRPLSPPPPQVSLSLSRYINNSPCLSTTQSWRFFPSDKVSRSFYKLIRVCSLWSRQLWTRRIDLAGESAVPDHDFKQNPMFLWRGRAQPRTIPILPPPYDWSNLRVEGGGAGETGSTFAWSRRLRWLRWDFDHSDFEGSGGEWNQLWILDVTEMLN